MRAGGFGIPAFFTDGRGHLGRRWRAVLGVTRGRHREVELQANRSNTSTAVRPRTRDRRRLRPRPGLAGDRHGNLVYAQRQDCGTSLLSMSSLTTPICSPHHSTGLSQRDAFDHGLVRRASRPAAPTSPPLRPARQSRSSPIANSSIRLARCRSAARALPSPSEHPRARCGAKSGGSLLSLLLKDFLSHVRHGPASSDRGPVGTDAIITWNLGHPAKSRLAVNAPASPSNSSMSTGLAVLCRRRLKTRP